MAGKRKRNICSIYLLPTEEDMRNLLENIPAPMILLEDFKTHNSLWGSEKMSTWGKMLEKILDRLNLLCINKKEETYYRAYNGCKLTIDLTLSNLTIVPEYKWSKEFKLRGSDHFPIIIEDEREIFTKQHQRWSIGKQIGLNFKKKAKLQQKWRTKTQLKKNTAA